jgi:hypothetical protein
MRRGGHTASFRGWHRTANYQSLEAWNGRELLHVGAVDSSGVTKLSSATSLPMFFDNRLHIAHKQHFCVLIGNQRQFD